MPMISMAMKKNHGKAIMMWADVRLTKHINTSVFLNGTALDKFDENIKVKISVIFAALKNKFVRP